MAEKNKREISKEERKAFRSLHRYIFMSLLIAIVPCIAFGLQLEALIQNWGNPIPQRALALVGLITAMAIWFSMSQLMSIYRNLIDYFMEDRMEKILDDTDE